MKTSKPTLLLVTLLISCIAQLAAGYFLPAGFHLGNGFAFGGALFTMSGLALVLGDWMRAHLASLPVKE